MKKDRKESRILKTGVSRDTPLFRQNRVSKKTFNGDLSIIFLTSRLMISYSKMVHKKRQAKALHSL